MALVQVTSAEDQRKRGNSVAALHEERKQHQIKPQVLSLPALATHRISLENRACYEDVGVQPHELLRTFKLNKPASYSKIEPTLVRRATRQPVNKPVSIPPDRDLPSAVTWTTFQLCEWIREIGYPQYMSCFKHNFISGRQLILFRELSPFPKIGITDFTHMKDISARVRELLRVEKPSLSQYQDYRGLRSISLPPDRPYHLFLQEKSRSSKKIDAMQYTEYQKIYEERYNRAWDLPTHDRKWRKPKEP